MNWAVRTQALKAAGLPYVTKDSRIRKMMAMLDTDANQVSRMSKHEDTREGKATRSLTSFLLCLPCVTNVLNACAGHLV